MLPAGTSTDFFFFFFFLRKKKPLRCILTASSLLQAGCSKVYITSRKAKACDEAVAALNALPNKRPGAVAIAVPADNARMDDLDRLVAEVKKTTDHVDILFANAGATWGERFEKYPEAAFSKVMDLNVKSVFYLVQKYVPIRFWCISTLTELWLGLPPYSRPKQPVSRPRASSSLVPSLALGSALSAKMPPLRTPPPKQP